MPNNSTTVKKKLPSPSNTMIFIAGCFLTTSVLAIILMRKGVISMDPAPGPFGNGTCYNDQSKPGEPVPCEAEGQGIFNITMFSGVFFAILAWLAWTLRVIYFNNSLARQQDAGSIQELESGLSEHTSTSDSDIPLTEGTSLLHNNYQLS